MTPEQSLNIVMQYAHENFAEAKRLGRVQGGCVQVRAYAALEIAERIAKEAGVPVPEVDVERVGACHYAGGGK